MESTPKTKILIIEDDPSMRKILIDQLQYEGFDVIAAGDGEEGLKKAIAESPRLILLDILMPQMDGLTMLEKLRQESPYGKLVPVILLTNLSADSEEIIKKVAKTEPLYYIVKTSLSIKEIAKKIKERLVHDL